MADEYKACPMCGQEVRDRGDDGGYWREAERKLAIAVDALACLSGERGEHLVASSAADSKARAEDALRAMREDAS